MDQKSLIISNKTVASASQTVVNISKEDFVGVPDISIESALKNVLSAVFFWGTILALLMIVISGIMYSTSSADETRMRRAKATLFYSIIGFVLMLISYIMVAFVVKFTSEA